MLIVVIWLLTLDHVGRILHRVPLLRVRAGAKKGVAQCFGVVVEEELTVLINVLRIELEKYPSWKLLYKRLGKVSASG